jgi:murein DD-endopeptidase MepM/ murein hydrolase activator NlpD
LDYIYHKNKKNYFRDKKGGFIMGSYNSQYESYYNTLVNKRKNYGGYGNGRNKSSSFKLDGKFFLKRFIRELIGVFILFLFVITCKFIITPQTEAAYKYSKEVLNKNYDYTVILNSIKNFDIMAIEEKTIDWMENIKVKLTGGQTLKDKLKDSFILPVEGAIIEVTTDEKKANAGIDIDAKEGTEVFCSYEGKVKDFGEDIQLGKYIVINHGEGIETKYAHLSEILVKEEATIKKGDIIAKSGSTGITTAPSLHFELLYMGENKSPQDYLSFAKN